MSERTKTWTIDGLTYHESADLYYPANECHFSAGRVEGHAADSIYIRLEKDNDPAHEIFILLRPDELAALFAVGSWALRDHMLTGQCHD